MLRSQLTTSCQTTFPTKRISSRTRSQHKVARGIHFGAKGSINVNSYYFLEWWDKFLDL